MVQEAQADPARTPEAIRAAAETASTAEQIQAVSGMIRDELRKQQAGTADVVCHAFQQGTDAALLLRSVQPVSYTHLDVYKRQERNGV